MYPPLFLRRLEEYFCCSFLSSPIPTTVVLLCIWSIYELPFIHHEYSWPNFLPFASPLRYSNVTTRPRLRSRKWWRTSSMPSAPAWCCQQIGSDSSEEKGFSLWILCSGEVKVQLDGPALKVDSINAQPKNNKCRFDPRLSNVLLNIC